MRRARGALVHPLACAVVALAGAALQGCAPVRIFTCIDSPGCVDGERQGVCQPTGFCSFEDTGCASGQRYVDEADEAVAGHCAPDPILPWWDVGWGLRKKLVIENLATTALAQGFPVGLPIDVGAMGEPNDGPACQSFYPAIRVARWSATTALWEEVARAIDDVTPTPWLWFDLASALDAGATTEEYWLYYDAPTAGKKPTPDKVFPAMYDGFEGALDGARWASTGSASLKGGELQLGPDGQVRSKTAWPVGRAFDVFVRLPEWTTPCRFGFEAGSTFGDGDPRLLWASSAVDQMRPEITSSKGGVDWSGKAVEPGSSCHSFGIERFEDSVAFRFDGALEVEHDLGGPLDGTLPVRIANQGDATLHVLRVRMRAVVEPSPKVTQGLEEARMDPTL